MVSGIMIGNWTRYIGFSKESEEHLDHFWELVDEFLNGVLFLLIGMSMLQFSFHQEDWVLMVIAVPLVLLSRYLSVKFSYVGFNRYRDYNPMSVKILTWGGLRGGLALAMAMAVPAGVMVIPDKNIGEVSGDDLLSGRVLYIDSGSTITPLIQTKLWEAENSPSK